MVLASASPRRKELLNGLGVPFDVYPADIPEEPIEGECCESLAIRLAREKAETVAAEFPKRWVLGADTIVVLPGDPEHLLGKPTSEAQAAAMLQALSGKEHWVLTGVALSLREDSNGEFQTKAWVEKSRVVFRPLSHQEIEGYVRTGEPMDKAGAYAIQGGAQGFVDHFEGSWSNIVGLPLESLRPRLVEIGLIDRG